MLCNESNARNDRFLRPCNSSFERRKISLAEIFLTNQESLEHHRQRILERWQDRLSTTGKKPVVYRHARKPDSMVSWPFFVHINFVAMNQGHFRGGRKQAHLYPTPAAVPRVTGPGQTWHLPV
jgi:hypothetical protein